MFLRRAHLTGDTAAEALRLHDLPMPCSKYRSTGWCSWRGFGGAGDRCLVWRGDLEHRSVGGRCRLPPVMVAGSCRRALVCSPLVTDGGTGRGEGRVASELRGPVCLGRGVIVGAGQAAPEGWGECRRVLLERASGAELRAAWAGREPLVIEIADGDNLPDPNWTMSARWWELDPKFNVGSETLRFLAESNSVDARDPTSPRFAPLEQAVRLGARRLPPGGPRDAVLPSGRLTWCDGGPLALWPRLPPKTYEPTNKRATGDRWGWCPQRTSLSKNRLAGQLPSVSGELEEFDCRVRQRPGGGQADAGVIGTARHQTHPDLVEDVCYVVQPLVDFFDLVILVHGPTLPTDSPPPRPVLPPRSSPSAVPSSGAAINPEGSVSRSPLRLGCACTP